MLYRPDGFILPYELNRHMDRHLRKIGHGPGEVKRQIFNFPPQTGKSMGLIHWMVQHLIKNPDKRIQYITYNHDRAGTVGADAKSCFQAIAGEYFGYTLDQSLKGKHEWRIEGHQGGLLCQGRKGQIAGNPGDVIVFDDPYKDHEEGSSPTCLNELRDRWDSVIRARFAVDTICVLTQTRWHTKDLTAHVMQQERQGLEKWEKLIVDPLPDMDVYDSYGELIVPAGGVIECRKTRKMFENERKTIAEYFWNCIYKQQPTAMEGSVWQGKFDKPDIFIKGFQGPFEHLVVSLDPSCDGKDMARQDYAAICTVGVPGNGSFHVDAEIKRSGPEESITRLIRFVHALPQVPDAIGIESKSFQKYIKDSAAKKLIEAGITCPVIEIQPVMRDDVTQREREVEKMVRIVQMLDSLIRQEMFRFNLLSPGIALLIEQLETVPKVGKAYHDDGPDALEVCMRMLADIQRFKENLANQHDDVAQTIYQNQGVVIPGYAGL